MTRFYQIDSAIFMEDCTGDSPEKLWKFVEDKTCRFLMITDKFSKRKKDLFPFASADRETWRICFGACRNGVEVDMEELLKGTGDL